MKPTALTVRIAALAVLAVATVAGTVWMAADGPAETPRETVAHALYERDYESIDDLTSMPGSLVVRGTVSADQETSLVGRGIPFTDSVVNVTDVIAGVPVGDASRVKVRQTGGVMADGKTFTLEGEVALAAGDTVLLFLKWDPEFALYWIVGGPHGTSRSMGRACGTRTSQPPRSMRILWPPSLRRVLSNKLSTSSSRVWTAGGEPTSGMLIACVEQLR